MDKHISKHSSTPPPDPKTPAKKRAETRVHIDSLALDPANACRHSERNLKVIQTSIEELGFGRSILLDADDIVRAGNGTITAGKAAGKKTVRVIETDGSEIIAIKRTDLRGARAVAMGLTDNRASDLHEYSEAALRSAVESIGELELDLDNLALTDEDIDAMCDLGETEEAPPNIVEDVVPEPPTEPITKAGDLWLLGDHRLLCGDSTKAESTLRLLAGKSADCVISDPPYAPETHEGARTTSSDKKLVTFNAIDSSTLRLVFAALAPKRWLVAFMDWRHVYEIEKAPPKGLRFVRFGIWIKPNGAPQFTGDRPGTGWEAVAVLHATGGAMSWNGGGHHGVWTSNKQNGDHPTQKPVVLVAEIVRLFSKLGELVVDPFLGSGTTLIAAEQLGRKCFGMEISPAYCDVIVARWEKLTGQKATRVSE